MHVERVRMCAFTCGTHACQLTCHMRNVDYRVVKPSSGKRGQNVELQLNTEGGMGERGRGGVREDGEEREA
eukprot:366256-Chlamydomonas_euryale.AAC.7